MCTSSNFWIPRFHLRIVNHCSLSPDIYLIKIYIDSLLLHSTHFIVYQIFNWKLTRFRSKFARTESGAFNYTQSQRKRFATELQMTLLCKYTCASDGTTDIPKGKPESGYPAVFRKMLIQRETDSFDAYLV